MKNNIMVLSICLMISNISSIALAQTNPSAQPEQKGSAVREFFRSLLFCGPDGRMCDPDYNPAAKNSLFESPEQVINLFNQIGSHLDGRRNEVAQEKNVTISVPNVEIKSSTAVTAAPPNKLNPPLDNDAFQRLLKSNSALGSTIQGYIQKKPESIPSLKLYAEGGDPFAQLFFGLAYSDDWTGIKNPAESCRWIKESATSGVSSARYFIAQRAYVKSPCFSLAPTLDQAKIWAELAALSNDPAIKKDAQELMLEILKSQISGNK